MEELQARHRKEQRDLQSRITQKKKQATKKTRKAVNEECERLQRELVERQQAEIARFHGEPEPPVQSLDDLNLDDLEPVENGDGKSPPAADPSASASASPSPSLSPAASASASTPSSAPTSEPGRPRKPNRQKARLARRAAEREAAAERAAEEAAKETDRRGHERRIMDETLARLGLTEIEVRPDGHCLYSAVARQLTQLGMSLTPGEAPAEPTAQAKHDGYRDVRAATADFVLAHADDFAPFLEEPIESYARKIKSTTEWGGQLELQAMARAYGVHINVIQGDGRIENFDPDPSENADEAGSRTIWLAYYRHSYGLGEHYNALSKQS